MRRTIVLFTTMALTVLVAAKRMIRLSLWQEGSKLFPNGFDDVWLDSGHGLAPSQWGSLENSPDDRASVSVLHSDVLPIGASCKFAPIYETLPIRHLVT